jgi:CheY-like chemotaxis protein
MTNALDILIVDDRPENLLTLEHLLESPELNIVRAPPARKLLACCSTTTSPWSSWMCRCRTWTGSRRLN